MILGDLNRGLNRDLNRGFPSKKIPQERPRGPIDEASDGL